MKDKIVKLLDDWKVNKHKQELIADELLILCGVSQQRELLIDFMTKTQGNLVWGWNLGQAENLADEYLKGNL